MTQPIPERNCSEIKIDDTPPPRLKLHISSTIYQILRESKSRQKVEDKIATGSLDAYAQFEQIREH